MLFPLLPAVERNDTVAGGKTESYRSQKQNTELKKAVRESGSRDVCHCE